MANIVILTQMQFPATIDGSGMSVGEILSGMIVIGKKLMQK